MFDGEDFLFLSQRLIQQWWKVCAMYLVVSKVDRIVGHGVMLITSSEIPVSAILDCLLELQQPSVSLRCA